MYSSCFRSFSALDKAGLAARCSHHNLPANGTKGVMTQALRRHWEEQVDLATRLATGVLPDRSLRGDNAAAGANGAEVVASATHDAVDRAQPGAAAEWLASCKEDGSASSWSSWGSPLTAETASKNVATDSNDAVEAARDILGKARLEADEVCRQVGVSPRRTVATQAAWTQPPM